MVEYLVQNWQDSFDQCYFVYEQIISSNFKPDVVIGVARGGWIPGRLLADFLHIKETVNIKVEAYELIGETNVEASVTQDINVNIEGKKVLVVDDIADSGESLVAVYNSLKAKHPDVVKTATIYYKPRSAIKPDFFAEETTAWVIFPWELFETMNELEQNFTSDGLSIDDIKLKFKQIGLPAYMVNSYFVNKS
ncbi:MAG: phosphoribosyltransferase [Candidatus Heimdallarchaeota archaeon]|nr:phosphoribosyltransferase [Candidatus Heimdallarchaeota archaeon]